MSNEVIVLDNLSRGKLDNEFLKLLKKCKVFKKDLTKRLNLNRRDFDYIFQFAAIVGVRNVYLKPLKVLDINVKIHSNLIEFAHKQKALKKFIFTSTSEVFLGSLEKEQ